MEREVVHPRSDMPRKELPGFIYSMNSMNPVPIIGGYENDIRIVVHGYEIKRFPGKDGNSGYTISLVSPVEKEAEKKEIMKMLKSRGITQKIEFW